jgi:hypothetical protein
MAEPHFEPQFDPENPPALLTAQVFNAPEAPTLAALEGKVVLLVGFQMLCPGSLRHALPQAERLARAFNADEVAVLGLHMVFENHKDMTPSLLEPFLKSEHITIPILVDQPNGSGTPKTMEAYGMQGTPTLLLFDRQGRLRRHYLGAVDDVRLGAEIMALAIEEPKAPREVSLAIERRLAATLTDPGHDHHHDGDCCGGHGHDQAHDHAHDHDHEGGCCGGAHAHDHEHDHDHDHDHVHGPGCDHKH